MIMPGIAKLACGNAKGVEEFAGTAEGFTASLAPLIAFPLVGAVLTGLSGNWKLALLGFVSRFCAVLILPLLVYEFSRLFHRQTHWLRTATALNWCYWLVLPVVLMAAIVAASLGAFGLPLPYVEVAAFGLGGIYLLWNRWFVLKSGLNISGWRAALILLASMVLSAAFSLLPLVVGLPLAGIGPSQLP